VLSDKRSQHDHTNKNRMASSRLLLSSSRHGMPRNCRATPILFWFLLPVCNIYLPFSATSRVCLKGVSESANRTLPRSSLRRVSSQPAEYLRNLNSSVLRTSIRNCVTVMEPLPSAPTTVANFCLFIPQYL